MAKNIKQGKSNIKRLLIEIPTILHQKIKIQAAMEGRSVKSIVVSLLEQYMRLAGNKTEGKR
ncbi:MAG: hypothetical protein HQL69_20975 [Magnetococcales bacterium]|nr:hypothetical protein [Magnetococcales bacterium]